METIFIRDNEMISFGGGWCMETILMRDNETISFGGRMEMGEKCSNKKSCLKRDNETQYGMGWGYIVD